MEDFDSFVSKKISGGLENLPSLYGQRLSLYEQNEWSLLPFVLSSIQGQLLNGGKTRTLHLDPSTFVSDLAPVFFRKRSIFEVFWSRLGSLKIYLQTSDKTVVARPLFKSESWSSHKSGKVIDFEISDDIQDLFLGFLSPYENLLAYCHQSESILKTNIDFQKPLVIRKSLWLDLNYLEQLLFLRLEKSRQWHPNTVHYDEVFLEGLSRLFDGINLETYFRSKSRRNKINVLKRFCRKLYDHGLLTPLDDESFVALNQQEEKDQSFVWQRFVNFEDNSFLEHYKKSSCFFLLKRLFNKQEKKFFDFISSGVSQNHVVQIRQVWSGIIQNELKYFGSFLFDVGAQIIPLLLVFIEWYFRLQPGHRRPLPERMLKYSVIENVFFRSSSFDLKQQFTEFAMLFSEHKFLAEEVKKDKNLCFALFFATEKVDLVDDYYQEFSTLLRKGTKGQGVQKSPSTKKNQSNDHDLSQSLNPLIKTETKEQSLIDNNEIHSEKISRSLVIKELDRLKLHSSQSYTKIKSNFIESLDEKSQKIMLSVSKSLRPELFEQQIRERLIKYMIKNPKIWQDQKDKRLT